MAAAKKASTTTATVAKKATAATKSTARKATAATKSTARKATATRTPTKRTVAKKATTAAKKTATTVKSESSSFIDAAAAKAEAAIKSLPTVDFTKFDLEALKQLDPRNIDLSKLDPRNVERPDVDVSKLVEAARDAAYTIVGFGVLAIQRAQVRRQEMAETISTRFGTDRQQIEELISSFESRLNAFDDAVEARIDALVGKVGPNLPESAESVLNQVHSVAKSARKQVRSLMRTAA